MDPKRFDAISKALSARVSRRKTVGMGGIGLGVAALATASGRAVVRPTSAQEATPAAEGMAADGSVLFVQTASGGSFVANPGSGTPEVEGTPTPGGGADYLLTLEGHPGGTVYFTDRPERVFGEAPTQRFLDGLGFSPADPPNAALVAQTEAGEDVVVLELINPTYDEAAGTITYGANVLAEYDGEGLAHAAERQQDTALPETFSRASLFIDDCDSHEIDCMLPEPVGCGGPNIPCDDVTMIGSLGRHSFCWHFGDICCGPCENHSSSHWDDVCNSTFAACDGGCMATAQNNSCWGD